MARLQFEATAEAKLAQLHKTIRELAGDMAYVDTLHAKVMVTSVETWKQFLERVKELA